jgi:hypothetical protein
MITFAQSWITHIDRLKGSESIIMFWKWKFLLGVGLFKFQIFTFFNFYCLKNVLDSFWNNLGSASQLLNRNNNRWPRSYDCNESQLDIGVSIMDPHMKRHVIFRPYYTPYRLWYRKQHQLRCPSLIKCKALSNIFVGHWFKGVLEINFVALFLAMTMHCISNLCD